MTFMFRFASLLRKSLKIVFVAILACILVTLALILVAITFKPCGNIVFSVAGGNAYRKVGEAALEANDHPRMLAIYKASNKPFLLVGPCMFHEEEDYEDFFFVNKSQVIRTSTDKGGDMWCRVFNRLYIIDDLSNCECLRAPFWDELKRNRESSVGYDGTSDSFVYLFRINNDSIQAKLTVPAKLFTPDMDEAPNRTLEM